MQPLNRIEINEIEFNRILEELKSWVVVKRDYEKYYFGYSAKGFIYYNGKDEFICQEYRLKTYIKYKSDTEWKQIRVCLNNNKKTSKIVSTEVSSASATRYVDNILKKYYSKKEIDERLHMFESDYNQELKQWHYFYDKPTDGKIVKITNTYKFDINGAHLDALCVIFPKAKEDFVNMYNKRKENIKYKNIPNIYVGCLAKKTKDMRRKKELGKYEKTYNWIVQRTTMILEQAVGELDGELIYANTDGIIVKSPKNLLSTSKELGDFKLEYSGNTYFYRDTNYMLYQIGNELKGSCPLKVREQINLKKGEVVHFTNKGVKDDEGNLLYIDQVNITKEKIDIYED